MFLGQSTEFNLKHSFLLLFALESLVKLYHKKKTQKIKRKKKQNYSVTADIGTDCLCKWAGLRVRNVLMHKRVKFQL